MKIYDLAASPNARRVRIFLAEKGLDIPLVPVDMMAGENATPGYLAKNSLGKMPVLELDDGTCIAESIAICRYLEALHPEPPLFGTDPLDQARVEMWHRRMELEILLPIIAIFTHTHPMWKGRVTQVPEWADCCRGHVTQRMAWLDKEIAGRDYIAANAYTVADIAAQCGLLMGKAALDLPIPKDLENLTAWWARVTSRPTARA